MVNSGDDISADGGMIYGYLMVPAPQECIIHAFVALTEQISTDANARPGHCY